MLIVGSHLCVWTGEQCAESSVMDYASFCWSGSGWWMDGRSIQNKNIVLKWGHISIKFILKWLLLQSGFDLLQGNWSWKKGNSRGWNVQIRHLIYTILSHSHFLCKVFSTKLFKSQQLLLFHVFMKETETHASVHYSWSDSMSSLSDFLVNIYFPFCVPYGSVPDLTVMSWAFVSLHYPALCQDIILLNP